MNLPALPDDDKDFTPDLARSIIAKYQELLAARLPDREGLALIRQMHDTLKSAVGKWHMESDLGERAEAYLRAHEQQSPPIPPSQPAA